MLTGGAASRLMRLLLVALLLFFIVSVFLVWRAQPVSTICTSVVRDVKTPQQSVDLSGKSSRSSRCPCADNQLLPSGDPSSPLDVDVTNPARGGFILAFRHYEQQTQAMKNFQQLQCLANSYSMRVVEPFVLKSFLSFPFDELLKDTKLLRFGQLIDLELWNKEVATRHGYSPVVNWEEFLREAPRNVITVCIRYRNPPHIQVPTPGFNYRTSCPEECYNRFKSSLSYLQRYGFSLLKKSCANFVDFAGTVTTSSFLETLVGKYKPEDVTVLMTEFRGFYGLYRLPVLSECGILHHKPNITILPSAQITGDTDKYIAKTLNSQPYVAILVRVERLILHLHYNVSTCANDLVQTLKEIHTTQSVSQHFLALDVGKFGSQGSAKHNLTHYGQQIFRAVYKNRWTFEDWENSFETLGYSDHAAYVANFQRAIAARSQCLVMVGGGGFQRQARDFYLQFHPDPQTQCVYKVCHAEKENN